MTGEIIFYQSEDGAVRLETRLENETLWLTINQMAELFDVDKSGISRHLKNIFVTGELQRQATVANFATVQREGNRDHIADTNRPLKNVFEAADARQKQAKKRSLCLINEHFEPVFNTAAATQIIFQRPAKPKGKK